MTLGDFSTVNRRDCIRWSGFGLAVTGQGLYMVAMAQPAPEGELNPYIVIHEDGRVLISAPNPDVPGRQHVITDDCCRRTGRGLGLG